MRAIAIAAGLFILSASAGWGGASEVSRAPALYSGGYGGVSSISCAAAGECAAGGYYNLHHGNYEAFVVEERHGSWGKPVLVPGTATLNSGGNARVTTISCPAVGDCAAGGYYLLLHRTYQAFVVSETNGSWGRAIDVPRIAALGSLGGSRVLSISCGAPGDCSAGGFYFGDRGKQAFVVRERHGSWGKAIEVPGTAKLNAGGDGGVTSISCSATGECAAAGYYKPRHGAYRAFVVSETRGTWGEAISVSGKATRLSSISCPTAGNCAAGGYYWNSGGTQAIVVSETDGSWGSAIEVQGTDETNNPEVSAISCAAAGECAAGGDTEDQDFVVSETNGVWGTAIEVPGTAASPYSTGAAVAAVSCVAAGDCSAGGVRSNFDGRVFVSDETNGSWGTAIDVPGMEKFNGISTVTTISCTGAGDCAAGGYGSKHDTFTLQRAFVVNETGGSWGRATILRQFPVQCVVPNVVGKTLRAAEAKLKTVHCRSGRIAYAYSNVPDGRVVAQQPKYGRILLAGTRVALTVSKG